MHVLSEVWAEGVVTAFLFMKKNQSQEKLLVAAFGAASVLQFERQAETYAKPDHSQGLSAALISAILTAFLHR
jgi:CBS-domain-containing membrane protein